MIDKINQWLKEPLAQRVLFFDEMLTPNLIRLAYWLSLAGIIWVGLGHMFSGGFGHFVEGIVQIAIGCILVRVGAEIIMLFFQLNDNMEKVAENTSAKPVRKKTSKKASKKQV